MYYYMNYQIKNVIFSGFYLDIFLILPLLLDVQIHIDEDIFSYTKSFGFENILCSGSGSLIGLMVALDLNIKCMSDIILNCKSELTKLTSVLAQDNQLITTFNKNGIPIVLFLMYLINYVQKLRSSTILSAFIVLIFAKIFPSIESTLCNLQRLNHLVKKGSLFDSKEYYRIVDKIIEYKGLISDIRFKDLKKNLAILTCCSNLGGRPFCFSKFTHPDMPVHIAVKMSCSTIPYLVPYEISVKELVAYSKYSFIPKIHAAMDDKLYFTSNLYFGRPVFMFNGDFEQNCIQINELVGFDSFSDKNTIDPKNVVVFALEETPTTKYNVKNIFEKTKSIWKPLIDDIYNTSSNILNIGIDDNMKQLVLKKKPSEHLFIKFSKTMFDMFGNLRDFDHTSSLDHIVSLLMKMDVEYVSQAHIYQTLLSQATEKEFSINPQKNSFFNYSLSEWINDIQTNKLSYMLSSDYKTITNLQTNAKSSIMQYENLINQIIVAMRDIDKSQLSGTIEDLYKNYTTEQDVVFFKQNFGIDISPVINIINSIEEYISNQSGIQLLNVYELIHCIREYMILKEKKKNSESNLFMQIDNLFSGLDIDNTSSFLSSITTFITNIDSTLFSDTDSLNIPFKSIVDYLNSNIVESRSTNKYNTLLLKLANQLKTKVKNLSFPSDGVNLVYSLGATRVMLDTNVNSYYEIENFAGVSSGAVLASILYTGIDLESLIFYLGVGIRWINELEGSNKENTNPFEYIDDTLENLYNLLFKYGLYDNKIKRSIIKRSLGLIVTAPNPFLINIVTNYHLHYYITQNDEFFSYRLNIYKVVVKLFHESEIYRNMIYLFNEHSELLPDEIVSDVEKNRYCDKILVSFLLVSKYSRNQCSRLL